MVEPDFAVASVDLEVDPSVVTPLKHHGTSKSTFQQQPFSSHYHPLLVKFTIY